MSDLRFRKERLLQRLPHMSLGQNHITWTFLASKQRGGFLGGKDGLRLCDSLFRACHTQLGSFWAPYLLEYSASWLWAIFPRDSITGWAPQPHRPRHCQLFTKFPLQTSASSQVTWEFWGLLYDVYRSWGINISGVQIGNDEISDPLSKLIIVSFLFYCICPVLAWLANGRSELLNFYTYYLI